MISARSTTSSRPVVAGPGDPGLDQILRRHGARRHHLSLQLDAVGPDLRLRPHLVSNTRPDDETAGPRAGCFDSGRCLGQHFCPLERRHWPLPAASCGPRQAAPAPDRSPERIPARRWSPQSKQRSDKQSPNHWAFPLVKCATGKSSSTKTVSEGPILPRTRPYEAQFARPQLPRGRFSTAKLNSITGTTLMNAAPARAGKIEDTETPNEFKARSANSSAATYRICAARRRKRANRRSPTSTRCSTACPARRSPRSTG